MMQIIEFNVQEPYKSFLLNGEKTIEGRLNKGKFKDLQIDDILEFPTGEKFKVKKIKHFDSFKNMLEMGGTENIIPDAKNIIEGISVYHKFYTPEQEKEFGVIGIYVKLIQQN